MKTITHLTILNTNIYVYFMNILDKPMLANYCIVKKDIGTEDMKWIIIN